LREKAVRPADDAEGRQDHDVDLGVRRTKDVWYSIGSPPPVGLKKVVPK